MSVKLFTTKEAAEYLCCSERTLRQLRQRGLPFVQLTGRSVRFRVADLDKWIESQVHKNTPLSTTMDKLG